MADGSLGEFEQVVLVAILRQGDVAFALEVRREIEAESGRPVSRGAFYTTLERLERKGLVTWEGARPTNARRREVQRRFAVTPAGLEMLRTTSRHLRERWTQLEEALEES